MPILSRYKEGLSWGQDAGQEWGLSELGELFHVGVLHINLQKARKVTCWSLGTAGPMPPIPRVPTWLVL